MDLSRNRSLKDRERNLLTERSLKIEDEDDSDKYKYEMTLKKRSIAGMLAEAFKEEGGTTKGIKWRRRRIQEEEK